MRKNRLLGFYTFLVFAFLMAPLLIIVVTAFGEADIVQFPIQGFTFKWFSKALSSQSFVGSCLFSLKLAFFATLLALVVGIPGAYALARFSLKASSFPRR